MLLDNRWIEQPRDLANSPTSGDMTCLFHISLTDFGFIKHRVSSFYYSRSWLPVWESGQPIRALLIAGQPRAGHHRSIIYAHLSN